MIDTQDGITAKTAPSAARKAASLWPAAAVTALGVLLYHAVLAKLCHDWWTQPDFSHGFIVPLFSAFLIYRDRVRLAAIPKKPTWWGLAVVAAALAWLAAGVTGSELFLSRTSGIALLAGIVLTFWGWQRLRRLAFPLLFLLLGIPIPQVVFNQITFPLQLLASRLAAELLPLVQVPVLRDGNVIRLPAVALEVVEACSGIRSLLSLGTLAVIYGYLLEKSVWKRVLLALASVPIAVAANAARIVGTGLCVQYWDQEKALGFFHEFSGLVIFVVSLAILVAVHRGLSVLGGRGRGAASSREEVTRDRNSKPGQTPWTAPFVGNGEPGHPIRRGIRLAGVASLLMATMVFLAGRNGLERIPAAQPLAAFPGTAGVWQSVDRPISSGVREVLGPGVFLDRYYTREADPGGVDLFIAYFPSQRTGDAIHSPKNCLPGAGWVFERTERVLLRISGMSPLQANEAVLAKGSDRMFAIYWYQAHGRSVASEYWAKFYLVADAMRLNRTDGALVRLITPVLPEETRAAARSRMLAWIAQFGPRLKEFIPE
jgi:exosortase D (VPLPA-CTERM-specific)